LNGLRRDLDSSGYVWVGLWATFEPVI